MVVNQEQKEKKNHSLLKYFGNNWGIFVNKVSINETKPGEDKYNIIYIYI